MIYTNVKDRVQYHSLTNIRVILISNRDYSFVTTQKHIVNINFTTHTELSEVQSWFTLLMDHLQRHIQTFIKVSTRKDSLFPHSQMSFCKRDNFFPIFDLSLFTKNFANVLVLSHAGVALLSVSLGRRVDISCCNGDFTWLRQVCLRGSFA